MENTYAPLFRRDFTLVVIGQIISLFGNAILRFALPLYLLRETGSSSLFGAVSAAAFLPMVFFSLFGGVLADRVNKRNIMVFLDFGTAGLILAFYLLHNTVPLVPLMIVCLMLLYGISGAYQPSVQASIPVLVAPERITQANAVINMVSTSASLVGPVLGGVLFGSWGIVPILLLSAACFFASAVMEIFIRIPYQRPEKGGGMLVVVRQDLGESWRYVSREKPVLLSVTAVLSLFNLVLSAALIVGIPVVVVNFLGLGDAELGVTQGALGLGGLAGGVLAGLFGGRLRLRQGSWVMGICALCTAGMGAALLPGVPVSGAYALLTAMSFVAMAASTQFSVLLCAAVQRETPPHLVGKVMAFLMAVSNCASPLGQTAYGLLFDWCAHTPAAVFLGAAALSLLVAAYSRRPFVRMERENA